MKIADTSFNETKGILTLSNHRLDQQKQDSGSKHLKGNLKVLHRAVKSNREKHDF